MASLSLEEELSVPVDASLAPGACETGTASIHLLPSNKSKGGVLPQHDVRQPASFSIPVDMTSSLRRNKLTKSAAGPRCLVVGRQASTADVRIVHGSISRRHALLFYMPVKMSDDCGGESSASDSGTSAWGIHLKDCGGKHGTYVNGVRIGKGATTRLRNGDSIRFGNCEEQVFVVNVASNLMTKTDNNILADEQSASCESGGERKGESSIWRGREQIADRNSVANVSSSGALEGRARREAEIASMTASLEDAPAYQKSEGMDISEEISVVHSIAEGVKGVTSEPGGSTTKSESCKILGPDSKSQESRLRELGIPLIYEAILHGHSKQVSALAVDPSGSRMVTGSIDASLKLWDFGGMDSSHRAFKEIFDVDGASGGRHPIVDLSYSNTGDRFLVATTSAQPKIFDRDGQELIQFTKGDVYVTDMSRTTGHTATVTGVAWHPLQRDVVLSGSADGSARTWDLNGNTLFGKLVCRQVYRAKNIRGQRTAVTAVSYHPSGRILALGTSCGSIQVWSADRVATRPDGGALHGAHSDENTYGDAAAICSLTFSADGSFLASRAVDDNTARVWHLTRNMKLTSPPTAIFRGVPCLHEGANCAFSPDRGLICIGSSIPLERKRGSSEQGGVLKFFNLPCGVRDDWGKEMSVDTSEPTFQMKLGPGINAVRLVWHPKINQIICGTSDGSTRIFYDPKMSNKGVLLSSSRRAKTKDALDLLLASRHQQQPVVGKIVTPNALPMFRDAEKETKRKREQDRMDSVKTRRPEPPATGVLTGGRTSASVNFTQFVVKSTIRNKNIAGKDPREELFKYSEGKNYVDQAYAGDTQVLADKTAEEEEEEMKERK